MRCTMRDWLMVSEARRRTARSGIPTEAQLSYLDTLEDKAKIIGWLDKRGGPLIIRANGEWETVDKYGEPFIMVPRLPSRMWHDSVKPRILLKGRPKS